MSKREYTVGHGKPPAHSRWRKGQSGNPSGGRKSQATPLQYLDSILAEMVTVNEGGKPRKICKLEAFVRLLVHGALNGDKQCMKILIELLRELEKAKDEPRSQNEIIASVLMRLSYQDWQL